MAYSRRFVTERAITVADYQILRIIAIIAITDYLCCYRTHQITVEYRNYLYFAVTTNYQNQNYCLLVIARCQINQHCAIDFAIAIRHTVIIGFRIAVIDNFVVVGYSPFAANCILDFHILSFVVDNLFGRHSVGSLLQMDYLDFVKVLQFRTSRLPWRSHRLLPS